MEIIVTNAAPAPAGHYSQAIRHNGLVFVSGQLSLDPVSKQVVEGGIEPQARQVIANISAILEASGSGLDKVLKATIYIPSILGYGSVGKAPAVGPDEILVFDMEILNVENEDALLAKQQEANARLIESQKRVSDSLNKVYDQKKK